MVRYIVKRIIIMALAFFMVLLLFYLLLSVNPPNPGRVILGLNATEEEVAALNEELGANRPLIVLYGETLISLFWPEKGVVLDYSSYAHPQGKIFMSLPYTLILAGASILVAVLVGVPLGVASALRRHSALDIIATGIATLLSALPAFWVAILFALLFTGILGWLPGGGVKQGFLSWVMPVLTQGLLAAAILLHHSRSAMLAQTEAAYVRTARGKGCSEKRMVFRHALRNALVPIISSVAASLGTMLGSSIIVENIFQIPGLGFWLLEAILIQDFLLSLSIVLALAILCMLVQFIADILCAILDPRLRQQPLRRWQVKPKMH